MMDEWKKSPSLQPRDADSDEHDPKSRDARRAQDAKRQEKLDDALDKALEESFPGSDPVSVAQPPQSVHDKHEKQKR